MSLDLLTLEKEFEELSLLCNGSDIDYSSAEETVYRYVIIYLTQYGNIELNKIKTLNGKNEDYFLKKVERYFKAVRKYIELNKENEDFFIGEKTSKGYFKNFEQYKSQEEGLLVDYVEDCIRLLKRK